MREKNPRKTIFKKKMIINTVIMAVITIIISCLWVLFAPDPLKDLFYLFLAFSAALSAVCVLIVILSYIPTVLAKVSINDKLVEIEKKRTAIENSIKQGNKDNVQEIIKLNLNQLDEYYTINKSQSKNSYNFSVLTILVGFIIITATIIMYYTNPEKFTVSLITGAAGLIAEFIGATSLWLYRESTKHVNEFIERLTYLQKVMLAIDLADNLSEKKREKQISKIIEGLIVINIEPMSVS